MDDLSLDAGDLGQMHYQDVGHVSGECEIRAPLVRVHCVHRPANTENELTKISGRRHRRFLPVSSVRLLGPARQVL